MASLGIAIDLVVGPEIDETPAKNEKPRCYVRRMAEEKNMAIQSSANDLVLTADTIVSCGTQILGKPKDKEMAKSFLELLSGRRHQVLTGIYVRFERFRRYRLVRTQVKIKNLSSSEIDWYLGTEEWKGKAGGYAIQGKAAAFVPFISGSYTNVMGLPLTETTNILNGLGYRLAKTEG